MVLRSPARLQRRMPAGSSAANSSIGTTGIRGAADSEGGGAAGAWHSPDAEPQAGALARGCGGANRLRYGMAGKGNTAEWRITGEARCGCFRRLRHLYGTVVAAWRCAGGAVLVWPSNPKFANRGNCKMKRISDSGPSLNRIRHWKVCLEIRRDRGRAWERWAAPRSASSPAASCACLGSNVSSPATSAVPRMAEPGSSGRAISSIRPTCRLVQRAYSLWRELERASGRKLLTVTGIAEIGRPDGVLVQGTLAASREHESAASGFHSQ